MKIGRSLIQLRQLFTQKKDWKSSFVDVWKQTFPNEEDAVKEKYANVKAQKHYTKEELEKIESERSDYLKGAIIQSGPVKEEAQGKKLKDFVPQSIRNKITESEGYKQYVILKENAKEFVTTSDSPVVNVGSMVYGTISQGSKIGKATEMMQKYDPSFNIYQLQKQATVIFKDTYEIFLAEKLSALELITIEQAYQYFSAHIKLNRTKKQKPKFTHIMFHYPCQIKTAKFGQKTIPSFEFSMKLIEAYCMINAEEKIVDGNAETVNQSIYEFSLMYTGTNIAELGHPWQIVEVKKLQEVKMLV